MKILYFYIIVFILFILLATGCDNPFPYIEADQAYVAYRTGKVLFYKDVYVLFYERGGHQYVNIASKDWEKTDCHYIPELGHIRIVYHNPSQTNSITWSATNETVINH